MKITVRHRDTGSVNIVDDEAHLGQMQQEAPAFFAIPHGKRETYSVYRGCLIVRNTPRFTLDRHRKPERQTAVYLFYPLADVPKDNRDSYAGLTNLAGSKPKTVTQAKRLIDRVLDNGMYYYDC